jgi:hypothetical protein
MASQKPYLASVLLLTLGHAAARSCTNLSIPVDISSRQGLFKSVPVENNLDITAFAQAFTRLGYNHTEALLEDYQTLEGSFEISAQFCHPGGGGVRSEVVQVLSHGVGFDKTWVFLLNSL